MKDINVLLVESWVQLKLILLRLIPFAKYVHRKFVQKLIG
jgi:hypothetical protein